MLTTRRPNITGLLQQAIVHGSRSTVLRPLGWLIGILATLVLAAIRFQAPAWIPAVIVGLLGLGVALYLSAFIFCLLTDKEALRTEKYSIQKLALQKGFVGDSLAGVWRPVADEERIKKRPETNS